jgi:putative endonuclease
MSEKGISSRYQMSVENTGANNALVCYSGGCDSTMIVNELVRNTTKYVRVLVIKSKQINDKGQKEAREAYIKHIEEGLSIRIPVIEVELGRDRGGFVQINGVESMGLNQQVLWLTMAFQVAESNEDIYFGHLQGEQVLTQWHLFEKIAKNLRKIMMKDCGIFVPLRYKDKCSILHYIKENKLDKMVSWCQYPVKGVEGIFEPCGKCNPCITNKIGEYKLELTYGKDKNKDITDATEKLKNELESIIKPKEKSAEEMLMEEERFYTYLIRGENNKLYCGYSDNPKKRLKVHQAGKGSKAIRGWGKLELVWMSKKMYKTAALKLERKIKTLTKAQKLQIIDGKCPSRLKDFSEYI